MRAWTSQPRPLRNGRPWNQLTSFVLITGGSTMDRTSALAAAALALAAGAVSAQGISFAPSSTVTFTQLFDPDGGVFAAGAFTSGQEGVLVADADGTYSLTYLGQESAFSDQIRIAVNGNELTEANAVGDLITGPMVAGRPIDFTFFDGAAVSNGQAFTGENPSFAVLGTNMQTSAGTFAYVIGYNDSADHNDWDDFIVGLNPTAPIPEPQVYALLLAGLGVMGFVARRRTLR
jgi:hypothetical protein